MPEVIKAIVEAIIFPGTDWLTIKNMYDDAVMMAVKQEMKVR